MRSSRQNWLQRLHQWFVAEVPLLGNSEAASETRIVQHVHTHEYVVTLRVELPNLLAREEAFRKRLDKEHQKQWDRFVRRHWFKQTKRSTKNRAYRLIPAMFVTAGSVILANAIWPIASYMVFTSPMLQQPKLLSPVPDNPVVRQAAVVGQAQASVTAPEMLRPKIIRNDLDYTNLANWFPSGSPTTETVEETEVKEYSVSIPTLGIENAIVQVGGTDLDNSLIQYPGTADPGEFGAPVIFGHSVLRQFYNPSLKNPRRYMSIFSKIMTMQAGEKIYIDYDGIRYTYSVVKKVEVKPEDLYILEQEYNSRQLKLITCVPEGTYLRRGVVLAQLETMTENTTP
jgi:sortase A